MTEKYFLEIAILRKSGVNPDDVSTESLRRLYWRHRLWVTFVGIVIIGLSWLFFHFGYW